MSDLLRVEEAARVLGIGRTKAFEMVARRELPVIRMGRLVRIPRAALDAWIAERTELAA
jgi:excisionase family DNA binding protein